MKEMNVAALMNQQTIGLEGKNSTSNTKGQSPFSNLLKNLENKMTNSLRESPSQSSIREKLSSGKQSNSNDIDRLLKTLITGDQLNLNQMLQQVELNQDTDSVTAQEQQKVLTIIAEFSSLLTEHATDNQKTEKINNILSNNAISFDRLFQSQTQTDGETGTLSNQLKQVITRISSDQTEHDSEGEMIQLLQQLISLAEKSDMPEETKQLKKFLSDLSIKPEIIEKNNSNSKRINEIESLEYVSLANAQTREAEGIASLKEQIEQLLTQDSTSKAVNNSNVKLMELIEQWGTLTEIAPQETAAFMVEKSITSVESKSIKDILTNLSTELELKQNITSNRYTTQLESLEHLFQTELKTISDNQLSRLPEIENLWKQINQVLEVSSQLENDSNVKVLKLLEQWSSLEKAAPQEVTNLLTQKQNTPEGQLWSRLLQTYKKRIDGQMQQLMYQNGSKMRLLE